MNADAQRRLTPLSATVVLVLGAVLLSLLFGFGRGVAWDAPRVTPSLPAEHAVALPTPPALQTYRQVWEHPLFSSDRKPIVSSGGEDTGVSLGDLQLTGVILTPTVRIALLGPTHPNKDDGSQEVRVKEGDNLPNSSWKLFQVLPRSAIFVSPSGRTELKLPAGAPIDQPATDAAAPGMQMQPEPPAQPHMASPIGGPMPPNESQSQRMQRLKAAILKQRLQQAGNVQGEH